MSQQAAFSEDDGSPLAARPEDFGIGELFWRIHEAVVVVEARSGRVVLWSPAAVKLFGYTAAEAVGKAVDLIVPEQYKALHHAGLARYYGSGHGPIIDGGNSIELPALHKDGYELQIELSLVPIEHRSLKGRFALAILRDVTERKRAENDRAARIHAQAERREAEAARHRFTLLAKASALLGSSLDYEATLAAVVRLAVPTLADWCIVYMTDGDHHAHSVAATHRDQSKERALQVLGARYVLEASGASPPPSENPVTRAISTGQPVCLQSAPPGLVDILLPDAVRHGVLRQEPIRSCICLPLPARDGIVGAITLVRTSTGGDYTEADLTLAQDLAGRAAIAIDNARLYQEARDAIRVRDEFLASASHELRTPVTTIKAFSQMLQRRLLNGSVVEATDLLEALQSIDGNASRLAAQINELLDLSRLQAGNPIELYRRPTDLAALLKKAVETHRLLSGRHTIRIESSPPDLIGMWDGFRLERALNHLLSNAVKYSPPGAEIVVALGVDATQQRRTAVLTVHDQGIGIPKDELPHIFEKYYRATNVPERAYGTGTGLVSVLEVLRLHGGTIGIESEEGSGTTCTVSLPCDGSSTSQGRSNGS